MNNRLFSRYWAVGEAVANAVLFPFANISTLDTKVKPGSQLDCIINVAYNNQGFHFDLGYNLYGRQTESLTLKTINDTVEYAIPSILGYSVANGNLNALELDAEEKAEMKFKISGIVDVDSAKTPSQMTHKFYTGIGYACCKDDPIAYMFGAGAHYELPSKNSALQTWGVNGHVGIAF